MCLSVIYLLSKSCSQQVTSTSSIPLSLKVRFSILKYVIIPKNNILVSPDVDLFSLTKSTGITYKTKEWAFHEICYGKLQNGSNNIEPQLARVSQR